MSKKVDKIAAKKLELEQNIARIQEGLEENFAGVKKDVTQRVQPDQFVKKHPLPVVGAAIITGFLLGYSGKRKTIKTTIPSSSLSTSIGSSIKKRLTQKAIDLGMDYLETRLLQKKEVEE